MHFSDTHSAHFTLYLSCSTPTIIIPTIHTHTQIHAHEDTTCPAVGIKGMKSASIYTRAESFILMPKSNQPRSAELETALYVRARSSRGDISTHMHPLQQCEEGSRRTHNARAGKHESISG